MITCESWRDRYVRVAHERYKGNETTRWVPTAILTMAGGREFTPSCEFISPLHGNLNLAAQLLITYSYLALSSALNRPLPSPPERTTMLKQTYAESKNTQQQNWYADHSTYTYMNMHTYHRCILLYVFLQTLNFCLPMYIYMQFFFVELFLSGN